MSYLPGALLFLYKEARGSNGFLLLIPCEASLVERRPGGTAQE